MVGLQTLDLAIGVRVPASQPIIVNVLPAVLMTAFPVMYCHPVDLDPCKGPFEHQHSNRIAQRYSGCARIAADLTVRYAVSRLRRKAH